METRRWSCTRRANVKSPSREFVNLLVKLDERFDVQATQTAHARLLADGFAIANTCPPDERVLSWIDLTFGGTWSGETANASALVLTRGGAPAAFAAYAARELRAYWLRAWNARSDVAVVGPLGIAPADESDERYDALIRATLGAVRIAGFHHALVAAVTEPLLDRYLAATGGRIVEKFSMDRPGPAIRTAVLASGGGTNFQAVLDELPHGLGLDVRALVVNRADAYAAERARRAGVPVVAALWNRSDCTRERYDAELIESVAETDPELVLMLGWMHLVSAEFLRRFPDTINIHPAFLPHDDRADVVTMPDGVTIPAFRGAHAIRDALRAASPWYGATAHCVVMETDRGRILKRAPLPLGEKDETAALAALRPTEHAVLLGAIRRYIAER